MKKIGTPKDFNDKNYDLVATGVGYVCYGVPTFSKGSFPFDGWDGVLKGELGFYDLGDGRIIRSVSGGGFKGEKTIYTFKKKGVDK